MGWNQYRGERDSIDCEPISGRELQGGAGAATWGIGTGEDGGKFSRQASVLDVLVPTALILIMLVSEKPKS